MSGARDAAVRLVVAGLVAAVACRPSPAAAFRVGLIGNFDGIDSIVSGLPARAGAALAAEQLNAAGGVIIAGVPHRVEIVDRATEDRPGGAASVARALVNLDSVDVLVGPQYSDLAAAAGAVAEDAEVPMIAPMASSADVTLGRMFVNRLAYVDAVQGRLLARFARDSLGLRRVAAMRMAASDYGRNVGAWFAAEFARAGGATVLDVTFDADDPSSRRRAVRRVLDARPEGVLLLSLEGADTLDVRRLRAGGFTGQLLGSDYWDAPALERDPDVRGAVIVTNWDRRLDLPATQRFRRAYAARHGGASPRSTAAATYDAVHLLAAAAARAGVRTGPRVAAALRSAGTHDGAFGRLRFVGSGDPERGAVILQMVGDSTRIRAVIAPPP